jgi:hypothetical protein
MFNKPKVLSRWCYAEDMPAVVRLDFDVSAEPWGQDDYHNFLMVPRSCVQIAVCGDELLGAVAVRLEDDVCYVERLLVANGEHFDEALGVLAGVIIGKLSKKRRRAQLLIHECRTTQLCGLRARGFRALTVVRNQFAGRDGILVVRDLFDAKQPARTVESDHPVH